jgi:Tfp pilus assembly PilM family ATPase
LAPKKRWGFSVPWKKGIPAQASAKNVRVGVELTDSHVRLVKLTLSSGRARSLEVKTVAIPEQGPDAPELSLVLRLALKEFLGKADADVWAMVSGESADLRFLQVPKTGKKQLSNAIYWTARKEAGFDDNEVVFDYELQGEVMEKGSPRLSVLAYTVKREEFEKLRNLFLQAGYPLAGLTLPSIAMRSLLAGGWVENGGQTRACLHLGGEYSRLEIFGGGSLQFVRVLKGGLAAMAQALSDASKEYVPSRTVPVPGPATEPLAAPGEAVAVVPEAPVFSSAITIELESMDGGVPPELAQPVRPKGLSVDEARTLLEGLAAGPEGLPPDHPGRDYSGADILEMLKPAWERLLRQVQMTFSHHAVTLGNEQVGGLLVSGPLGAGPGLLAYLSEKLGVPCAHLDPLSPDNLGRLQIAAPALSMDERLPYSLVLGLTGAVRSACNLLYTYKQKEEEDRVAGLNRMVALCWLGVAVMMLGVLVWQQTQAYWKRQELSALERRLSEYRPLVDMPLLLGTSSKVRQSVDNMRRFGARNLASAVLRDITDLTPENVRIFSISLDLGTPDEQPQGPQAGQDDKSKQGQQRPAAKPGVRAELDTLSLEGYVKGDSQILESLLSAYLVRLRTSPLLGEPSVTKRSLETTSAGEDVLRFTLTCQVRR